MAPDIGQYCAAICSTCKTNSSTTVKTALYRMGKKGGKSRRKGKGGKYPSKAAGQDEEDTQMSGVLTKYSTAYRP